MQRSDDFASHARDLWLPTILLSALGMILAAQLGMVSLPRDVARTAMPETVEIAPRAFSYRAMGDYLEDGVPADPPLVQVEHPAPLTIMKYQVSVEDYGRCVAAGACAPAAPRRAAEAGVPVTGVSFDDAEDYARWLSAQSGHAWRLPSAEEWVFAAGSRAVDPALQLEANRQNPAERWLARYEQEAAQGGPAEAAVLPTGHFGENEFGVADLAGNVWEWTTTCNQRTRVDAAGQIESVVESCGVRIVEGRHRTAMSGFIRDARSGGCSVGAPPDNLGFRLVREAAWYAPLQRALDAFGR